MKQSCISKITMWGGVCTNSERVPRYTLPLRAIAWDQGSPGYSIPPTPPLPIGNIYLYFQDPSGHVATVSFTGAHPDIVLGNDPDHPNIYWAAVAFVEGHYRQGINYYRIENLNTSAFSATYVGFRLLSAPPVYPLYDTKGFPHLDVWSEAPGPGNLPFMKKLVAVYNEGSDIFYKTGNVNYGALSIDAPVVQDGDQPDVGAQLDIATGKYYAYVVYRLPNHFFDTITSNTLEVKEITIGGGSITRSLMQDTVNLFPRIESMGLYDSDQPEDLRPIRWQAIASVGRSQPGGPSWFEAWGYNTRTNISKLSTPQFPKKDCKANAVAAGVGPVLDPDVGNIQYTTGFLPHAQNHAYARVINAFSGVASIPYYQIDEASIADYPEYFSADVAKSLALSHCSNSGKYTLSVWFDGKDKIYQKLSLVNTPQFRNTGIQGKESVPDILYPNPAREVIHCSGTGRYRIYNMQGAVVAQGQKVAEGQEIPIAQLATGNYILQLKGTDTETHLFTKE